MKKSLTIALAASILAATLAVTPNHALAASSGKHIKKVTIEMLRASGDKSSQPNAIVNAVLNFFGL